MAAPFFAAAAPPAAAAFAMPGERGSVLNGVLLERLLLNVCELKIEPNAATATEVFGCG